MGLLLEATASFGGVTYLVLLFFLCASPLLLHSPIQSRYTLYTIFLLYYFFAFGLFQYLDLFLPLTLQPIFLELDSLLRRNRSF